MIVVFDTSVLASAIFWPASTARRCLAGAARRRFRLAVTGEILEEYATTLGKQRSRDPEDDMFLACALAAEAQYIVAMIVTCWR